MDEWLEAIGKWWAISYWVVSGLFGIAQMEIYVDSFRRKSRRVFFSSVSYDKRTQYSNNDSKFRCGNQHFWIWNILEFRIVDFSHSTITACDEVLESEFSTTTRYELDLTQIHRKIQIWTWKYRMGIFRYGQSLYESFFRACDGKKT